MIRFASAAWVALGCAISLAGGTGSAAQSPASPPPEGLEAGEGAGYPKGHYAELDALPDWGGIWFLNRTPPGSPREEPALAGTAAQSRNAKAAARNAMRRLSSRRRASSR